MSREWRSLLWRALAYGVLLELMLAAAIWFWPDFRGHTSSLRAMAKLSSLRKMVDEVTEGGVAAYVMAQHFFKGCNTLGVGAAVLFAAGAVAGEAQRGTLEIWLARPVSRLRLLSERFVGGALATLVPVFLSSLTIPWLIAQVEEQSPMSWTDLLLASTHQGFLLLAVYSATFLLSSLGRAPLKIAFGVLFLATFEFALYLVKDVTRWSLFRTVDIPRFMQIARTDRLDWTIGGAFLAVSALCFAGSLWCFRRRVP